MHTEAKIQFLSQKKKSRFFFFLIFDFFGKLFSNWWQWFNFWKIVTLPQCVNGRVDFLILKSRKLKKFRISRFRGWWCFFFEVFCWFLRFWRKKGKITNKNYSTLANNVFLLFLLHYDAQKWWLGFDDEFDQKLFQVRFDVQKKNPGKQKRKLRNM